MARVHQVGSDKPSIIGYIVVGVILAVIVVGAVFVAKHQIVSWFSPDGSKTVATVDKEGGSANNPKPETTDNKSHANSGTNNGASNAEEQAGGSGSNGSGSSTDSGKLPATGPAGALGSAAVLAVVVAAAGYFVQSKRRTAIL